MTPERNIAMGPRFLPSSSILRVLFGRQWLRCIIGGLDFGGDLRPQGRNGVFDNFLTANGRGTKVFGPDLATPVGQRSRLV